MSDGPLRKILLYLDGSDSCITAAQYAIALAKFYGSEITAVYVVNLSVLEDLVKARIFIKSEELDYERDLEEDGRRYLNYVEELAKDKGVAISKVLLRGVVHDEVVKKAEEIGADLIVMGELEEPVSRSDTFYDEGERIFRRAKCPVLVVKGYEKVERLYESLSP